VNFSKLCNSFLYPGKKVVGYASFVFNTEAASLVNLYAPGALALTASLVK